MIPPELTLACLAPAHTSISAAPSASNHLPNVHHKQFTNPQVFIFLCHLANTDLSALEFACEEKQSSRKQGEREQDGSRLSLRAPLLIYYRQYVSAVGIWQKNLRNELRILSGNIFGLQTPWQKWCYSTPVRWRVKLQSSWGADNQQEIAAVLWWDHLCVYMRSVVGETLKGVRNPTSTLQHTQFRAMSQYFRNP